MNRNEEFAAVYRTELGSSSGKKLSLYYAAEIDALDRSKLLEIRIDKQKISSSDGIVWMDAYTKFLVPLMSRVHFVIRKEIECIDYKSEIIVRNITSKHFLK